MKYKKYIFLFVLVMGVIFAIVPDYVFGQSYWYEVQPMGGIPEQTINCNSAGGSVTCLSCQYSNTAKIAGAIDATKLPGVRQYITSSEGTCYRDYFARDSYIFIGGNFNSANCADAVGNQSTVLPSNLSAPYCRYSSALDQQCAVVFRNGRNYTNGPFPTGAWLADSNWICDSGGGNINTDPTFSISVSPAYVSIKNGESASYTVTITSLNGFSNSVYVTPSGCPDGATCNLGPSPIVPPANGSITTTYTVSNTSGVANQTYTLNFVGSHGGIEQRASARLYVGKGLNNASCDVSGIPGTLVAGTNTNVTVSMLNNGERSWVSSAPNPYKLGMQNQADYAVWSTGGRSLPSSPINPGQTAVFNIPIRVPSTAGTYTMNWRMVEEGVAWFGPTCSKTITVNPVASAVNGYCGTATTTSHSVAPSSNLCSSGTASSVTQNGTTSWDWTCTGANGGSTASCTAPYSSGGAGSFGVTISANPSNMTLPTSSTNLTWSTYGSPDSCTASGAWSGAKSATGGTENRSGLVAGSYTYTITCAKAGYASQISSAVVVVNPASSGTIDVSITATPSTMNLPTNSTNLTWTTSGNPDSCTASGSWAGSKSASGGSEPISGLVQGTYSYTITCTKAGAGTVNDTADVIVNPNSGISVNLTATDISWSNSVPRSTTLAWTTTGSPDSCSASPSNGMWTGAKNPGGGSQAVNDFSSYDSYFTYRIVCSKAGFSDVSSQVTVYVPPTTWVSLNAAPLSMTLPANSTTLTWDSAFNWYFYPNATCVASGAWSGTKTLSGNQTINGLTQGTHRFTLTCSGDGGDTVSQSVDVDVTAAAVPIGVSISANPSSMTLPTNSTALSWVTTGAPTSCSASGSWSGSKSATGGTENRTGLAAGSYTYTITCSKVGYSNVSDSVTVDVVVGGGGGGPTAGISLQACQENGLGCGDSVTVPQNTRSMLRWGYNGADNGSCSLSPAISGLDLGSESYPSDSGTVLTPALAASRTYTITCSPSASDQATVNVNSSETTGTLNVILAGKGTVTSNPAGINCGSDCSHTYNNDTTVTLTATASAGRIFTGWSGACSGRGACQVIINGAKTVYANFAVDPNYKEF